MERGKFIVFEGLDGSGKGTQISLLSQKLSELNIFHHITAEPTRYATGGLVRDALAGLTKRTPAEMAGLFLADRIAHCENPADGIKTLMERSCTVICDRYYYSSIAYQGADLGAEWVAAANTRCPAILKPDICVFLDVPTDTADGRISSGRASREIFENAETIERVRKMYFAVFELLKDDNVAVINADRAPEKVAEDVFKAVKKTLRI